MNLLVGVVVVLAVTTFAVTAMLVVRRRAPEGSYFADGDRAAGVFGVLATGFAVILGFIIFLAFETYDAARVGAESEALTVAQQVETAQYLPGETREELTGLLICYARSVVGTEWPAMDRGTLGDAFNPWGAQMFQTMRAYQPTTAAEESAYDRWMEQTGVREQARIDRVHGVEGVVPLPIWIGLFVIAAVIFVFMLFFADRAERARTQAMLMGSVAVVISLLLLLLVFFDNPHGDGVGRLEPVAMERSLRLMADAVEIAGIDLSVTWLPADGVGGDCFDTLAFGDVLGVTVTNEEGRYTIVSVPTGPHVVRAQRIGFRCTTRP